ncbi:MAG: 4'-phosphopantetheinyl transferase superfamily protein [Actinomycetota bacterium]|nr:4'-phosphopantetheinyl transferase superfamily protein [Actinomycetota bacterium]
MPEWRLDALREILSEDELEKAGRFRFTDGGNHYIAARGALRQILAGYLETRPGLVRFRYGPSGKPQLDYAQGDNALRFSVSHSGGLALYAFSPGREVGVDIEQVINIPSAAVDDIARQYFPRMESIWLKACPARMRGKNFFRFWTRREAYLKAIGAGLSDACPIPVQTACRRQWSTAHLHVHRGYAACVAVQGRGIGLKFWQWAG